MQTMPSPLRTNPGPAPTLEVDDSANVAQVFGLVLDAGRPVTVSGTFVAE
jgi:hypothetical protein